jgi:transposase
MQAQRTPVETVSFGHFLSSVMEHYSGRILVVMDNLSAHRSKAITAFLDEHQARIRAVYFPAYSPELNPVEYLWSAIKGKDVANLPASDLTDLEFAAEQASRRVESDQSIMQGFLKASSLFPELANVPG